MFHKRGIVPRIVIALFSIWSLPSAGLADDVTRPSISVDPPRPKPVKSAQTYAVDVDCRKNGNDLQPVSDNGFIKTQFTTTMGVLVSTEPASKLPDASDKLPDGAIGMALAYVTDGEHGSDLDNRDHGCRKTFVVRRTKDLWIIPFYSLHTKNDAGSVVSFISAALSPLTSLFSLITGGPLAATVTSRITDYNSTKSAFSTMLGQFNKDQNFARSITLGEGTTTISTTYATITVKVSSIPSLIADTGHDFTADLRKLGDSQSAKVADPPASSCAKLNNNLASDGLTSDEDRAYVVAYEAMRTLTTKEQIMDCLGRLVKVAAKIKKIWVDNPDLTITEDLAAEAYAAKYSNPAQLSFQALQTTLDKLMTALGRYSLNGQAAEYKGDIVNLFQNGASLVDVSFKQVFKNDMVPTGVPEMIDFLISKGYYHYGCFAQADGHTGAYTDGASAIFLAIKAKPEESSASSRDVLAIHPIFADSSRKVQSFRVSDNSEWIATLLKSRDNLYDCNGFTIN
jgi:hypothetical protein